MGDDIDAEIDITPTRHPGIQVNPAQNVKGEVDPHAHEQNVRLEELHPDLGNLERVINIARHQKRIVRNPYGDPAGVAIHDSLLYWERELQNSDDPRAQEYLRDVQDLLHHHHRQISFQNELITLINKYSDSQTPDHLLASYLIRCLQTWNEAYEAQVNWYKGKPNE
jgi:hypothetical protein